MFTQKVVSVLIFLLHFLQSNDCRTFKEVMRQTCQYPNIPQKENIMEIVNDRCDEMHGCKHVRSTNEFRDQILAKHNELRNQYAMGVLVKGHTVADMSVLSYSMELEHMISCLLNACPSKYEICFSTATHSYIYFNIDQRFRPNVSKTVQKWFQNPIMRFQQALTRFLLKYNKTENGTIDYDDNTEDNDIITTTARKMQEEEEESLQKIFKKSMFVSFYLNSVLDSTLTHLGCSRVIRKQNQTFYELGCAYVDPMSYISRPDDCGGKVQNKDYPALCGDILPYNKQRQLVCSNFVILVLTLWLII